MSQLKNKDMESVSQDQLRWGFVGAGRMATALIQGMIRSGLASAERILASDPLMAARLRLEEATGVNVLTSNIDLVKSSDVLVLAIKPQGMSTIFEEIGPVVDSRHLVISIAAGVTLATLESGLGQDLRIVRVMPNTPALIGEGAAGYCLHEHALQEDEGIVRNCLESVGLAFRVPESSLDAITGLSGSGPAFVYMMIEALADGGVRSGLPREIALALAAQTVLGSAKMVRDTGQHPAVLKDQVASPGGTTIAGIQTLERAGLRAALIDAVEASTRRSAELSEEAERRAWS